MLTHLSPSFSTVALMLINAPLRFRIVILVVTFFFHTKYTNPPVGRSTADVGSLKARNRMLRIATWNVRSLNKPGVYENVCREMDDMRLDILGLSEARWVGSGSVMEREKTVIYSGGEKHQHGVAVMLTKHVAK